MEPLNWGLLPDTAEEVDGVLSVGGVRLDALVEQFGSPLFVYDEDHLIARCREATQAFDDVAYASKAFLCRAMARLAYDQGMRIDVASGGELAVVLAAGVPASAVVVHGNNKSAEEIGAAVDAKVHALVIDSFDELDRLEMYRGVAEPIRVMIRVTPGLEVHTFAEVQTGQVDSKFGFGWATGEAERALHRVRSSPHLELIGLHVHIGSQVFSAANFADAIHRIAPMANDWAVPEFCVGGGLGVAYVNSEESATIAQWGSAIRRACDSAGVTARVSAEPGRSIVARAGLTVYRVGTIKAIPGVREYVAVDGGMSDNPRPVLYGSGYEAVTVRAPRSERNRPVRIVGKHCESGDVLIRDAWVGTDLAVGDLIATPVTGAYGYSLASNYNRVPRPAVVFVRDGSARLVCRREGVEDLLRLDVFG